MIVVFEWLLCDNSLNGSNSIDILPRCSDLVLNVNWNSVFSPDGVVIVLVAVIVGTCDSMSSPVLSTDDGIVSCDISDTSDLEPLKEVGVDGDWRFSFSTASSLLSKSSSSLGSSKRLLSLLCCFRCTSSCCLRFSEVSNGSCNVSFVVMDGACLLEYVELLSLCNCDMCWTLLLLLVVGVMLVLVTVLLLQLLLLLFS